MKLFALYLKSRDSLTRIIGRVQNWNIKGLSFYLRTLPNYWQVTVTMHSVGHSQFWCSLGIEHQILAEIMLWQVSSCTSNSRKSWALWRSDAITVNECCPVQWSWCQISGWRGSGALLWDVAGGGVIFFPLLKFPLSGWVPSSVCLTRNYTVRFQWVPFVPLFIPSRLIRPWSQPEPEGLCIWGGAQQGSSQWENQ